MYNCFLVYFILSQIFKMMDKIGVKQVNLLIINVLEKR